MKKEEARPGGKRKPIKDEEEEEESKKEVVLAETIKEPDAIEATEAAKQPQEIIIRAP